MLREKDSEQLDDSFVSRLLVWPTSTLSKPYSGLAVGWSHGSGNSHSQKKKGAPVETVVVAGVLPILKQNGAFLSEEERMRTFLKETRQRIQKLKGNCCYCCTCADAVAGCNERAVPLCPGCTRKLCFQDLDVVGFLDVSLATTCASRSGTTTSCMMIDLPSFRLTNGGQAPWWSSSEKDATKTTREQQLLLYNDVGRNGSNCLYWCMPGSQFSRTLLTRLTHTNAIVALLQENENEPRKPPPPKTKPPLQTTTAADDTGATTPSKSPFRPFDPTTNRADYMISHIASHSLLVKHFSQNKRILDCVFPLKCTAKLIGKIGSTSSLTPPRAIAYSCNQCSIDTIMPETHYETVLKRIDEMDALLQMTADALLGLLLGGALAFMVMSNDDSSFLSQHVVGAHFTTLRQGIDWLGSFPIGFKLNERLTEKLGHDLSSFLRFYEWLVASQMMKAYYCLAASSGLGISMSLIVFTAGVVLGGSGLLALLHDLLWLGTAHIFVLTTCFRLLYKAELYLLSALWRLFRGKKKNILRGRTDTMEYDSMQLLLGTILFAVALFLFTTIFVYHIFFAASELCITILSVPLLTFYVIVKRFPWGSLLERSRSDSFIDKVYLVPNSFNPSTAPLFDSTNLATSERTYNAIIISAFSYPAHEMMARIPSALRGLLSGSHPQKTLIESVGGVRP